MDADLLSKLFSRDTFYADELFLFQCIHEWAIEGCKRQGLETTASNKRLLLGDLIYCIRFPFIDYDIIKKNIGNAYSLKLI
jgi:hypothetical protein